MSSPPPAPVRLYWDACVFLSLIEGTPERMPHIQSVLEEMDKGACEICTSVLTIAEVSFAKSEKDGKLLSPAIQKTIDKLWSLESPFRLVEVHRTIALEAQQFVRAAMSQGLPLKPPDAIHLATAVRLGASEFQTYDTFRGKSSAVAVLCGLRIIEPRVLGKIVWPVLEDEDVVAPSSSSSRKKKTRQSEDEKDKQRKPKR